MNLKLPVPSVKTRLNDALEVLSYIYDRHDLTDAEKTRLQRVIEDGEIVLGQLDEPERGVSVVVITPDNGPEYVGTTNPLIQDKAHLVLNNALNALTSEYTTPLRTINGLVEWVITVAQTLDKYKGM